MEIEYELIFLITFIDNRLFFTDPGRRNIVFIPDGNR